jgi:hypothetical protein
LVPHQVRNQRRALVDRRGTSDDVVIDELFECRGAVVEVRRGSADDRAVAAGTLTSLAMR